MRKTAAFSLFALAGCMTAKPPAFLVNACANEIGERRYETPAPAGLAVPALSASGALHALILTGAAWVEHNEFDPSSSGHADIYREGPGRYSIRLTRLDEPECQEALRAVGYDPKTRSQIKREPRWPPPPDPLRVCLEATRLGDLGPKVSISIPSSEMPSLLRGWTAPFVLVTEEQRDSRSEPHEPVRRTTYKIVRRETGQPIMERVEFLLVQGAPNWLGMARVTRCGNEYDGVFTHVFAPAS